jgi:hypothetical protein
MKEAIDSAHHKQPRPSPLSLARIPEREGQDGKKVIWIRRNALKSPDSNE